jgi:chromate transporter
MTPEISGRQPPTTGAPTPSLREVFLGFFFIGVNGFGGVMPFARRMLVEQRRWMSEEEFIDALSMCQFVPGPNIVNMAVITGARFQGKLGSLAGMLGLMIAPMVIVIGAYTLLLQVADNPIAIGAIRGMSAVAAGLVVALALKVGMPMLRQRDWRSLIFALAAAAAVGVFRLPLLPTLAVLAPLSIATQWMRR